MRRRAWSRTREILEAVLDAPDGVRDGLLDDLCETGEQRREIEELLALDRGSAELLAPPREGGARELIEVLEARRIVGERFGAYRVDELIATGGMGDVYKASRVDGEGVAAVKVIRGGVISEEARSRFARERRLLARLSHPNIARLIDAGEQAARAYIVLEYIDGVPLKEYCEEHSLGVRERVSLIATVCEAVAHAHQNLIVHRDLKPGNVLVTRDGTPKLLDFGISKLIGEVSEDPGVTVTRALTPRYASPEQLLGRAVTTASDVYSIGVILHETLTGERPERDGDRIGRSGANLDLELRAILQQALAFDARQRYASAEALAADLHRYLSGERVAAYPASRAYRARKWASRHRVLVASAGVAALLIIGGGATGIVMASRLAMEKRETLAAKEDTDRVNRFLGETLGIASRAAGRRGDLSWRGLLDDAGQRLSDAGFSPRVEGELRLTLARSYYAMRRIEDSREHFEAAVRLLVEGYGPRHLLVAQAREGRADYLHEMGAFDEAIEELQEAQAIRTHLQGPGYIETGRNIESQGHTEMVRRRFDEGERLMLAAKSLYERGGHEAEVVRVLDRLGILSMFRGEHDAAVSYREEALALQEHRYGSESATAALTRFRLGEAHLAAGHDEEAERLMRASLTVIEELHGPGMGTAHYHSRLGDVLARLGDAAGADAEHREAVRLLEAGLPASHHDWIYARENYARFLRSQGRHSEALVHMREVAANYEDMLGADHLRTRIAREAVQRLEERVSGG